MTFLRPTLSDLVERARTDIETRLPGADARLRHSVLDVLARAHSGAASGLYGYLDFLSRQILPDTAEAEYLARWASIWGIQRKAASVARGDVVFTGQNGVVIPAGTQLSRIDGALYETTSVGTIAGGIATVAFASIDAGAGTAPAALATLTLTTPVAGLNAQATVGIEPADGSDEEDDESLLSRLLTRIQQPPKGGAKSDYEAWALQVPGVTRAWVFPAWMGIGTVGVTFAMDGRENIIPLQADLDAVEAHIDVLRPVTAGLVVFAPTPQPINLLIRLVPNDPAVKAAVELELADVFARDAEPGGTIWLSRLREAISIAAGEHHHSLELPSEDVAVGDGEIPVLGVVSWL